jgi:hypothetical protein
MVPTVAFPPATPFTDQVTDVLLLPLTEDVNCCVFPTWRAAWVGETATETAGGGWVLTPVPLSATEVLVPPPAEMLTVPETLPCVPGRNATPTIRLLDGARVVAPCQPERTNAELFTVRVCTVKLRPPMFLTVIVCEVLVVPTV